MKKNFLLLCFVIVSRVPVFAQDAPEDKIQKTSIIYIDTDSSRISEKKFTQKVNNGQYSVLITVKQDTTYLAINDVQPANRKAKRTRNVRIQ